MKRRFRIASAMLLVVIVLAFGISTASAANISYSNELVEVYSNGQFVVLDADTAPYYCQKIYPGRGWVNNITGFYGSYLNTGVCMGLRYNSSAYPSRTLSPASHTLTNQLWFRDEGKKTGTFKQTGYTGNMRVIARQDDANGSHTNTITGYFNADASA